MRPTFSQPLTRAFIPSEVQEPCLRCRRCASQIDNTISIDFFWMRAGFQGQPWPLFFFEAEPGNKAVFRSHHAMLLLMWSPEVLRSVCWAWKSCLSLTIINVGNTRVMVTWKSSKPLAVICISAVTKATETERRSVSFWRNLGEQSGKVLYGGLVDTLLLGAYIIYADLEIKDSEKVDGQTTKMRRLRPIPKFAGCLATKNVHVKSRWTGTAAHVLPKARRVLFFLLFCPPLHLSFLPPSFKLLSSSVCVSYSCSPSLQSVHQKSHYCWLCIHLSVSLAGFQSSRGHHVWTSVPICLSLSPSLSGSVFPTVH